MFEVRTSSVGYHVHLSDSEKCRLAASPGINICTHIIPNSIITHI